MSRQCTDVNRRSLVASDHFYADFRYPFMLNMTLLNGNDSPERATALEQGMKLTVSGNFAFEYGIEALDKRLETGVSGSVLQVTRKVTASYSLPES
ncbi:hypothetical protein CCM_00943 [Cordyceps militaris CM01]|uniref:Uncharacterized protein n=1 Tax=Cordyceps militaris (strain CM01) TaxID=983644 RepID=G3J7B7_CORMM|nr:uncharacterized protein CCM_00943 [Cordyceps militaris CM01]EGX96287.1 hypothetical protein CCM_00943 [Cordyceps militaris CM01]